MPGLSTTMPPPGRTTSCRRVVVCRPRAVTRNRAGREELLADERVDEGGLTDARRPDQRPGRPRLEDGADAVEPESGASRDGDDGGVACDREDLGCTRVGILGEVRLRQQDHRPGAAVPGEREVAVEQAQVRLVGEREGDEDDVDVGGHDLLASEVVAGLVRRAARELRPAREHHVDRSGLLGRRAPRATQSPTTGRSVAAACFRVRPGSRARTSPLPVRTS